jgi:cytochrome c oxidase subunit 1
MPRRVYRWDTPDWEVYNLVSSLGSFILAVGVLLTLINVVISVRRGRRAGNDPWQGNTLEWFVPSPPPPNNFDVIPRVRSVEPMKDIRHRMAEGAGARETVPQPAAPGAL